MVHGAEDPLVPDANGEALARGIPGARLVTLSRCGHLPTWERPEDLSRAIRAFLATC